MYRPWGFQALNRELNDPPDTNSFLDALKVQASKLFGTCVELKHFGMELSACHVSVRLSEKYFELQSINALTMISWH